MPPLPPDTYLKIMRNLTLSQGRWAGRKLEVLPHQESLVRGLFQLQPDGARRYREAYVHWPRKQAKTTTLAALALGLLLEEPGGQVIGAAGKRDQAGIMLDSVKSFVQSSSLGGVPLTEFFDVRRYEVRCPERDSVYRTISSDAPKAHGLNPHAVLMDELHSWTPTQAHELYYAMVTAVGARDNPLVLSITTPGEVPSGLWHELYTKALEVKADPSIDPQFYSSIYQADPEGDWSDPEQWRQANPGWGELVDEAFLRRQWENLPAHVFARLHLAVPTTSAEQWLAWEDWEQCDSPPDIPDGAKVFVGLDAAISRDTFGVALCWLGPDDEFHVKAKRFQADGGYIDPKEVETLVLGWASQYAIQSVGYDPAFMGLLAAQLQDRGVDMVPFPQTGTNMNRAAEVFQLAVRDGRMRHGGDLELSSQLANVGIRRNERGVRISKGKSGGPVDMIVATAMAMDLALAKRGDPEDMPIALFI